MKVILNIILPWLGYSGDPDFACASTLPAAPMLFLTGMLAVLAVGILLRCCVDILVPQTGMQRLTRVRSMIQWSVTITLLVVMFGGIETIGAQQLAMAAETLRAMGKNDHPMSILGLLSIVAGTSMAGRAILLLRLDTLDQRPFPSATGTRPSDGAFVATSGFSVGGLANRVFGRPGGGIPAALLGVCLTINGHQMLTKADFCL